MDKFCLEKWIDMKSEDQGGYIISNPLPTITRGPLVDQFINLEIISDEKLFVSTIWMAANRAIPNWSIKLSCEARILTSVNAKKKTCRIFKLAFRHYHWRWWLLTTTTDIGKWNSVKYIDDFHEGKVIYDTSSLALVLAQL